MSNVNAKDWITARRREQRRRELLILCEFATAAATGNEELLSKALRDVEARGLWRRALLMVTRQGNVAANMPPIFLRAWLTSGDHIRNETGDDHVLADALRVLLPPYAGSGLTLYRGDSFYNRRRRTYGLAWSSTREIGEAHAQGFWQTFDGGSVLLCTEAPADSIICAPHLLGNDYGEDEYLVDRRRLRTVRVLRRYPQCSWEDLRSRSCQHRADADL